MFDPSQTDLHWGLIHCPNEGGKKRWKKILRYMQESGICFDFVQSEGPGSVERLAAMMTRKGYKTIVVVGGDAALNHALTGIFNTVPPNGKLPRLGVIPNGYGNDFARYWGMDVKNYRQTIDNLRKQRVRRVDVGVLSSPDNTSPTTAEVKKQTSRQTDTTLLPAEPSTLGYFLNCINIGTVASIIDIHRKTKHFLGLRTLSYFFGTFLMLFRRMNFKYDFTTSGEHIIRKGMTLCIGSAHGYGQTPSAVPYNGLLDMSLVSRPQITQLFHGLWLLYTGRFLGHKGIEVWRTRKVRFHHIGTAHVSLDGRIISHPGDTFEVTILPEAIEFLY